MKKSSEERYKMFDFAKSVAYTIYEINIWK